MARLFKSGVGQGPQGPVGPQGAQGIQGETPFSALAETATDYAARNADQSLPTEFWTLQESAAPAIGANGSLDLVVVQGSPTFGQTGAHGRKAVRLTGAQAIGVEAGNVNFLDSADANDFTARLRWQFYDAITADRTLMGKRGSSGWSLRVRNPGSIFPGWLELTLDPISGVAQTISIELDHSVENTWMEVAVTFSRTAQVLRLQSTVGGVRGLASMVELDISEIGDCSTSNLFVIGQIDGVNATQFLDVEYCEALNGDTWSPRDFYAQAVEL